MQTLGTLKAKFLVYNLGVRILGLGLRFEGFELHVSDLGFRASGLHPAVGDVGEREDSVGEGCVEGGARLSFFSSSVLLSSLELSDEKSMSLK